ncbi:ankyrin-3 [Punica granatum]|uniref:Uncharacterized protein n=2 Tax=Punica granatum TaxID=22663 RepID=A0A218WFZ5_PUNGR|nr:ankyrin-3 [Punica granatum]OWM71453.1 hypothetical protein CDL15_Pgr005640 [Punica granatum]PKI39836.1 hypothetical protein CRG98_039769 [Punica granatum]
MPVFAGKQVVPVDYEVEVSQRLLEASLAGDLDSALQCIADPSVDVNYVGAVSLKTRRTDVVPRGESASEVRVEYEEFRTDVTALFLAVHAGNVALVRKLLSIGADVNQTLFKGFATTAAVREGHLEILEILLKAGASQSTCEEALLEACNHGQARVVELLMSSDLIRPHITVHALVMASGRGFVDVVDTLMQCGVDACGTARVLLKSTKPSLHMNVDCSAIVAAVVSRQAMVVRQLLQAGARTDIDVRLGAWSWDPASGEEFRVGAGLAEPYPITWCAVEYYESSGSILSMLLKHLSPNSPHYGRTLIHHAILCGNSEAVNVLIKSGAGIETPIKTTNLKAGNVRPIHMAARLGLSAVLQCLVDAGCDLNSRTELGDTALMISAKYKHKECLKVLAMAGADFGLTNACSHSVSSIAGSNRWALGFQQAAVEVLRSGKIPFSSDYCVFSPLMVAAQVGDAEAVKVLVQSEAFDLDYQDENGFSAVMIAALKGHVEAFRALVYAGADVRLSNRASETAISISKLSPNRDQFEKVMLEFALEKGSLNTGGFYALHSAARRGDLGAAKLLTSRGCDVNILDGEGYTPLMLAAREGHGPICKLLISCGAHCHFKNDRGETALFLAQKNGGSKHNAVAEILLDEFARELVLAGAQVQKHTKGGRGSPHPKEIKMVMPSGVLRWGSSKGRNVICRGAEVGPSNAFRKNWTGKGDADEPGIFRVVTTKDKEVHFVCGGGRERAELWVRGIKLVTREAICGKQGST